MVTAQLPNWNEFVVLTLALERIGAVINPVSPIFRHRALRTMLRLARSTVAIIPIGFREWDYPAMYAVLRESASELRYVVVVHGDVAEPDEGLLSWDRLLRRGAAQSVDRKLLDWLRPSPDDIAQLIFTSGTTGEPKGVMHTDNTLGAQLEALIQTHELTDGDVFHMASTVGHQTGFLLGVCLPLYLGARAVYQDVWDPAEFVRLVEAEHVTFTGRQFHAWRTPCIPQIYLNTTSAPCASSSAGRTNSAPIGKRSCHTPGMSPAPQWGLTEVGPVTTTFPNDPIERAISSDGRAYPQMKLTVRDSLGKDCPPGQEGELYTRGAFLFAGYVQGRRFTERCFTPDGWFTTGDRAVMDVAGYIRITGRSKDIIIRAADVPVKEIEDVLMQHPKVRSVALVGLPDPRVGEIGCACVIPEYPARRSR